MDGECDEFNSFAVRGKNEREDRLRVRERETKQLEPSSLRGRFSFEAVQDRNPLVKLGLTKGRRCILLDDKSSGQDRDQLIVWE